MLAALGKPAAREGGQVIIVDDMACDYCTVSCASTASTASSASRQTDGRIFGLLDYCRGVSPTTKFLPSWCFTWWFESMTHPPHGPSRLPRGESNCTDLRRGLRPLASKPFPCHSWWFTENNHQDPSGMVGFLAIRRDLHITRRESLRRNHQDPSQLVNFLVVLPIVRIMCRVTWQATTRFLTTMA